MFTVPGTLPSAYFTFAKGKNKKKKQKPLDLFPAFTFIVSHLAGVGGITPHLWWCSLTRHYSGSGVWVFWHDYKNRSWKFMSWPWVSSVVYVSELQILHL